MDIYNDDIRRQAKASQVEHNAAMRTMRNVVDRLFGGDSSESAFAKADFLTGGVNRRRFLQIGGMTVATAAVFAACGTDDSKDSASADKKGAAGSSSSGDTDTTMAGDASSDVKILRTASSLEVLAVDV